VGFEKKLTEDDVRSSLRHQMNPSHRTSTFFGFLRQLVMCIKTVENEKDALLQCRDFNINDAFKVLLYGMKSYPPGASAGSLSAHGSRQNDVSDLELNTSLLLFPGQMISGDPLGCNLFCHKYATNHKTQRFSFEDFIHAFLPVDLKKAKTLL